MRCMYDRRRLCHYKGDCRHCKPFQHSGQKTLFKKDALKKAEKPQPTRDFNTKFLCPFCLHIDEYVRYQIATKHGYHKTLAECPECHNKMEILSLTARWTPEQYAEWIYNYKGYGVWSKVKFDVWKKRLWRLGWAERFWKRYKELKGEWESEEDCH